MKKTIKNTKQDQNTKSSSNNHGTIQNHTTLKTTTSDLSAIHNISSAYNPTYLPTQQEIEELHKHIQNIREAVVLTHIGPDQDAIMSLTSWAHILQTNTTGIIRPLYEDEILLEVADMQSLQVVERVPNIYDALVKYEPSHVFLVDISHVHRLTKNKQDELRDFLENKTTTIILDHHPNQKDFEPDFEIIKPLASNCELLYYIAKALNFQINQAAQDLLIGILADTAYCRYAQQKSRSSVYTTQALFELSKNPATNMREAVDRARMKLTSDLLPFIREYLDNLVINENYAYTFADYSNLSDHELVSARRAKSYVLQEVLAKLDVPVYYIISGNKNKIKISFRSVPPINIRKLAEKLGGGGHDFASGAYIEHGDMQDIIEQINREIEQNLIK